MTSKCSTASNSTNSKTNFGSKLVTPVVVPTSPPYKTARLISGAVEALSPTPLQLLATNSVFKPLTLPFLLSILISKGIRCAANIVASISTNLTEGSALTNSQKSGSTSSETPRTSKPYKPVDLTLRLVE